MRIWMALTAIRQPVSYWTVCGLRQEDLKIRSGMNWRNWEGLMKVEWLSKCNGWLVEKWIRQNAESWMQKAKCNLQSPIYNLQYPLALISSTELLNLNGASQQALNQNFVACCPKMVISISLFGFHGLEFKVPGYAWDNGKEIGHFALDSLWAFIHTEIDKIRIGTVVYVVHAKVPATF